MKTIIHLIFAILGTSILFSAEKLKSYSELGLLASAEEFGVFIRSPIHERIIKAAPVAMIYRLSTNTLTEDGEPKKLPLSKAKILTEKYAIKGGDLAELRKFLLDHNTYASNSLSKMCGFNADYRIDFRSNDFEVSFLICTSCQDIALCVNDELLEILPIEPSLAKFDEFLKKILKDDKFTQELRMVDSVLEQIQKDREPTDPFGSGHEKASAEQDASSGR